MLSSMPYVLCATWVRKDGATFILKRKQKFTMGLFIKFKHFVEIKLT